MSNFDSWVAQTAFMGFLYYVLLFVGLCLLLHFIDWGQILQDIRKGVEKRKKVEIRKRIGKRTILVVSCIGIILTSLAYLAWANHRSTHYYLSQEKGSQVTLRIPMDGVVHLYILDVEYLFCYYYSAGVLEESPLKVSITKNWGPMGYGDGGFYAIAGSINYDADRLLKIEVLESNVDYVILLVERV